MTVARVQMPLDAHLLRMRLEAAGIPVFLRDQHVIRMIPLITTVIGGVRVEVPADQADAARELLAGAAQPDSRRLGCPHCGSTDLRPGSRRLACRLLAALMSVFSGAGLVPASPGLRLKCGRCGEQWLLPDSGDRPTATDV